MAMRLNFAKFLLNGGCGYVLKPPHMRAADTRTSGGSLNSGGGGVAGGGAEALGYDSSEETADAAGDAGRTPLIGICTIGGRSTAMWHGEQQPHPQA